MNQETTNNEYPEDFYWNEDNKTWCFAGETVDGLLWETDDFEATDKDDAIQQAISYIEAQQENDKLDKLNS